MMKHLLFCLAVTMALASMSVQAYTAGTYEAETSGLNGPIKVQVTVTADAITAVKVLAQRETDGIGSKAIESMPAAFVDLTISHIIRSCCSFTRSHQYSIPLQFFTPSRRISLIRFLLMPMAVIRLSSQSVTA